MPSALPATIATPTAASRSVTAMAGTARSARTACEAALWTTGQESPQQSGAAQPARTGRAAGGARAARQPGRSGAQCQRAAGDQLFRRLRRQVRRSARHRPHRQRAHLHDTLRGDGLCAALIAVAAGAAGGGGGGRRRSGSPKRLHPDLRVPARHRARRQGMREARLSRWEIFNPATGSCMCPPGTILEGRECIPIQKRQISCRPPLVLDPITDTCVPQRRECPPPLVLGPADTCICPPGTVMQVRKCVPQICPPSLVPGPCRCPEGTVQDGGLRVPLPSVHRRKILNADGVCTCPPPMVPGPVAGTCICPRGSEMVDGKCVTPPKCPPPQIPNVDGI